MLNKETGKEITKHGLSIGIERSGIHIFLSLRVVGKLTHADYETITPMIDAALSEVKEPKVKAIVDISDMDGWEARAAWDDFKIGLKHKNDFGKIAIYGNKHWQEMAAKIGSWFISGEIKYFGNETDALSWLMEN
ncbi:SpoIIAA-like [Desulfuromusa kysingii]|uniref:SpoIIAA-like n=1 Tax=Desulfuromusa kysingii TaxID=37625 RepID=A0A1H3W120_9BACT|nr:STAS/SEC14 domain-containing protein [Desulfuromusa kysingii]SDZ80845.1 SpoIIAA-like [Desulfuromusa kysingii]